ncbi:MAG TPA: hypothetical protein VHE81_14515 [Lacipirellulaceae bacterium]|nr:hypothetical protein [Lacipirellulaceae bacterium]
MLTPRFGELLIGLAAVAGLAPASAHGAIPNSLVLNEVNTVSGSKYLDNGNADSTFGRVEGNGQNWMEFLVVQGDPKPGAGFKNTLDLRGWTMHWSYDKDNLHGSVGSGDITFTNDPLWAAVPRGTIITLSEWSDVWYDKATGTRDGGYDGFGVLHGTAFNSATDMYIGSSPSTPTVDPHLYTTDTSWDPAANGGGANGDWHIHVFAGEQNPDTSYKYFNFSGSVTTTSGTFAIGTEDGGLFAANNDNWQYTITDAQGNVIQGPYGEQDTGLGSTWRVSSTEILRLEGRFNGDQPQSIYLDTNITDYADGSESTFGKPNVWSSGAGHQGLDGLQNWLQMGDANLDGQVTSADYIIWRKNLGSAGGWLQGDFSGDKTVDMADYDVWRAHFGATSPSGGAALGATTVPEPQSFALLALGVVVLSWRPEYCSSRRRLKRN